LRPQQRSSFSDLLTATLAGIAVLDSAQLSRLEAHYRLLKRWNERMNLTSIRTLEEAVVRHYAESVFLATLLSAGSDILDFGSGAGFPGFPMAVFRPDWRLTLLESNQRKAVFLREATRSSPNITVLAQRGERLKGHWDWFVSRAVRADDVVSAALRNARRIGLLIGAAEFGELAATVSWNPPVPLPWGDRRVAALGAVR